MMYLEVLQELVVYLLEIGKISGVSVFSLIILVDFLCKIYDNMDYFVSCIVLCLQEISNNLEIICCLGVIVLNVGLEFDIYGYVNLIYVVGVDLMNGIGGSGDFECNVYLLIFMVLLIVKEGKILIVVLMCSYVDYSEYSVKVIIIE